MRGNHKRKKIIIIHFQPLELYPPVMNMIDFLKEEADLNLTVITNKRPVNNKLAEYSAGENVKIIRTGMRNDNKYLRYLNYFLFYISGLVILLWNRPRTVFYLETLSAGAALVYKKIMGTKVRLMVHYHEYNEPEILYNEMVLSKWLYKFEKPMFKHFSWISQTNEKRMDLFKTDNGLEMMDETIFHILPNYPPKSWSTISEGKMQSQGLRGKSGKKSIIKLVFVGSLGFKNMYLQEVINWVVEHQAEFSLDVYSYNIKDDAKEALVSGNYPNITYNDGCNYYDLPQILCNYDIGLDIYKPFALNHINGVSNKVFEYLACGLDVWFTTDKPLTSSFVRDGFFPTLIPVDFKNLQRFDYTSAISRKELIYKPSPYYYENVYPELSTFMLS